MRRDKESRRKSRGGEVGDKVGVTSVIIDVSMDTHNTATEVRI